MLALSMLPAAVLLAVLGQGIDSSPIVVALLALLAVPGLTSLVTGAVRAVSTLAGVKPETVVYCVSLIVTGAVVLASGDALPGLGLDGPVTVAAWLTWGSVNARAAQAVYDLLLVRLLPTPA